MRPVTPKNVAELQFVLIIISAVPTYFVVNPLAAKAVVFGGLIALVNVMLLNWRMCWGERHLNADAAWHFRQAFRSFFERFVVAATLFAVGLKLLKLLPLAMLTGFVLGQLAWVAAPLWVKLKRKND
jgi:ATP synthase protein I